MIIKEQVKDIVVIGEDTSKKAKISQDKLAKLQYLLTKGLYKDPITAVIAEWTNNGIDSVVQAGKNPIDYPVIVSITTNGQHIFSVEDKGIGLDDKDFENICMNYLESTKENDNDTIGHFGIGMKSFLSLERSATFTCRKHGIERKYLVYEGAEFVNYELIYTRDTNEEDGVKAELTINDWTERGLFLSKAKQKLAYYDTAVLIVDNVVVTNKIFRSDDFQWSVLNNNDNLHICLKDVYYSIDWEALGIYPIKIPIALRLSLSDGITPTPSRESYITNEKTKKVLLNKIEKVADWFVNRYNTDNREYSTFLSAFDRLGRTDYNVVVSGVTYYINPITVYSKLTINPIKVEGITKRDPYYYRTIRSTFLAGYSIVAHVDSYGTMKTSLRKMWIDRDNYVFNNDTNSSIVLVLSPFSGNIKEFLKTKYKKDTLFLNFNGFKRKLGSKVLYDSETYYNILGLKDFPKKEWREYIEEYNFVLSSITSTFIDETRVADTPEFIKWVEDKKEAAKQKRLLNAKNGVYNGINKKQGDVTLGYSSMRYNKISFKKSAYPISELHKNHFVTVLIQDGDDVDAMKKIIPGFYKCQTIKFATVGKLEFKKIPECSQFINVKKFMSIECKPFLRLASALVFNRAIEDLNKIKAYKSNVFKNFVSHIHKDEMLLKEYISKNSAYMSDDAKNMVLDIADEHKLYDYSLWDSYLRVKEACSKYDFINLLQEPPYYNTEMREKYEKLINQILLFRKKYYDDLPEGTKIVIEN